MLYLLLAAPLCLTLVVLTPPQQVADEPDHFYHARTISLGQILPSQVGEGLGGTVLERDILAVRAFLDLAFDAERKVAPADFAAALSANEETAPTGASFTGIAIYAPVAYAVPALGLAVADRLGLDVVKQFYAGRGVNAVFFLLCMSLSIAVAPTARMAFMTIGLLPMVLFQGASYSADAWTLPVTLLACALVLRAGMPGARPSLPVCVAIALLIAAVATVRLPLIMLLLPAFAVIARRSLATALLTTSATLLICLSWLLHANALVEDTNRYATISGIFGAPVSPGDQIAYLLSAPDRIVAIAWNTLEVHFADYVRAFVGVLGWLNTHLGPWYHVLARSVLIAALVFTVVWSRRPRVEVSVTLLLAALIGAALTFGSLYATWTPVGYPHVLGVQGRYFLTLSFLCAGALAGLLAVPSLARWRDASARIATGTMYGALAGFAVVTHVHVVWVMVVRYYLD